MSAVIDFRAVKSAREQAEKIDPRMVPAAVSECVRDQLRGGSGKGVAANLQARRLAWHISTRPTPPTGPEAA